MSVRESTCECVCECVQVHVHCDLQTLQVTGPWEGRHPAGSRTQPSSRPNLNESAFDPSLHFGNQPFPGCELPLLSCIQQCVLCQERHPKFASQGSGFGKALKAAGHPARVWAAWLRRPGASSQEWPVKTRWCAESLTTSVGR